MKKFYLFLIAIAVSFGVKTQVPAYDLVLEVFFKNYKFDDSDPYLQLKFHKKKEGWFTAEEEYSNPGKYKNVQLFWSSRDKKFKKLSYSLVKTRTKRIIDSLRNHYFRSESEKEIDLYNYNRNVYFGYAGWDWDVIQDYANSENISDTTLESLGRAYSSYAQGYFFNQWGNTIQNNEPLRRKLKNEEPIDTMRRNKFVYYTEKCIASYKKLLERNPKYETMVGTIDLKYANEFLFAYSSLGMAGYPADAKKFIIPNIYNDSILSIARNYLSNVSNNGILITGGDNDTYPLWFLQQNENLRKDVLVINYNLLASSRYISWFNKQAYNHLFQTKPEFYNHPDFLVFYEIPDNLSAKQPSISAFLKEIQTTFKPHPSSFGDKMITYGSYSSRTIVKKIVADSASAVYGQSQKNKSISIELSSYIFLNDYILIDIFNTNFYTRQLHFTSQQICPFLDPYLIQQGSIYKVILEK